MLHYAPLDVSNDETAIHIVDETGRTIWRGKRASDPEALATALAAMRLTWCALDWSSRVGSCGWLAPDRALDMANPVPRRIVRRPLGPTAETTTIRRRRNDQTEQPKKELTSKVAIKQL